MLRKDSSTPTSRGSSGRRQLQDACPPPAPCVCNGTGTAPGPGAGAGGDMDPLQIKFLVPELGYANFKTMLDQVAVDYRRIKGDSVRVSVTGVPDIPTLQSEVLFDVRQKAGQFDGYIINPVIVGELAINDGVFDLTEFIRSYDRNPNFWLDVLLFYRDILSTYDNKILLLPFDGDVLSLFYRKDLLDLHDIAVPRTWEEYTEVARYFHGMEVEQVQVDPADNSTQNVTLAGSCIGRVLGCGGGYWAQLILATMTQYQGTATGSLFDTRNLDPLLGPAMEETLRFLEEQAEVGSYDEFDGCVNIHIAAMNRGECVLSYDWGNSFTEHIAEDSVVKGRLGVANTPGSPYVLNRTTMELVNCTALTCPFAERYVDDETGRTVYVNQAPYAAYGGWSGAVSNNVSPEQREAAADFLAFASDTGHALRYVIPDRTREVVPTGQDPYRHSLLDEDTWVARGYPVNATRDYLGAILSQLSSENVVADIRFPQAADILDELDLQTWQYLDDTARNNRIPPDQRAEKRRAVSKQIEDAWEKTIRDYDAKESTTTPILEVYQRIRGVYMEEDSSEQPGGAGSERLGTGAIVGIALGVAIAAAIVAVLIASVIVRKERKKREEDSWYIPPDDIHDTGEVLGKGSFGIVTKGFLRGTAVALKKPTCNIRPEVDEGGVNGDKRGDHELDQTIDTTHFVPSNSSGNKSHALQKELLTLIQLRHPNIVETLGATIKDGQMIIVLAYMPRSTIRSVLRDPNGVAGTAIMSVEIQWALQVAQGLSFLHSFPPPKGPLLHNDLKSSNVLVDGSFNAHISDFGLASKTINGLWGWIHKSGKKPVAGSLLWMAPEVLNGSNQSEASDVYSYGIFLCEMMTRQRPFDVKAYLVPREASGRSLGTDNSAMQTSSQLVVEHGHNHSQPSMVDETNIHAEDSNTRSTLMPSWFNRRRSEDLSKGSNRSITDQEEDYGSQSAHNDAAIRSMLEHDQEQHDAQPQSQPQAHDDDACSPPEQNDSNEESLSGPSSPTPFVNVNDDSVKLLDEPNEDLVDHEHKDSDVSPKQNSDARDTPTGSASITSCTDHNACNHVNGNAGRPDAEQETGASQLCANGVDHAGDSSAQPSSTANSQGNQLLDGEERLGVQQDQKQNGSLSSRDKGEDGVEDLKDATEEQGSFLERSIKVVGRRVSFTSLFMEEDEETVEASESRRRRDSMASLAASQVSESSRNEYELYGKIGGKRYSRDEIIEKVKDMRLDPPFRPDLPDDSPQVLRDICIECWHKNPKRRPTMKEIEDRLSSVVSNETVAQQLMRRGSMFDTILPRDVQDKLARGVPVPPVPYDDATVIFSDIVEFTNISATLSDEEVGDLIGRLLVQFDILCRKHNVKKLDIIGDAFIGVAGVPNKDQMHASKAAAFALDAIAIAKETLICPKKPDLGFVRVRFGIASGSVVATVLGGIEHPKYTLFGDTVNTASRMESNGKPNHCQCTEKTANMIEEQSKSVFRLESRGKVNIKGKGEMATFWVRRNCDDEGEEREESSAGPEKVAGDLNAA